MHGRARRGRSVGDDHGIRGVVDGFSVRWRRALVSEHDESGGEYGRWRRHGYARRCHGGKYGVYAVSPDGALHRPRWRDETRGE